MFNLNNKGQSLVMFVLIVPIFLLIITLVYDVGSAIYEKNRLSNTIVLTISYGLDDIDNVTKEDLNDMIMSNSSNLKYLDVSIDNKVITIKCEKNIKGIIGKMFNFDVTTIEVSYMGKIVNEEKKIERIV